MLKLVTIQWIGAILVSSLPLAAHAVNLEHENALRLQRIMTAHRTQCDCTAVLAALEDLGRSSPEESMSQARAGFARTYLQHFGRCARSPADDLDLLYDTLKTHNRGKAGSRIAVPDPKAFKIWAGIEVKLEAPANDMSEAAAAKDGWMARLNAYHEAVRTRHEHFHLASQPDLKKSYEAARLVFANAPQPFYAHSAAAAEHIRDKAAWDKFKGDQLGKLDRLYRFKIEKVFNQRTVSPAGLAEWEANVREVEAEFSGGAERVAPTAPSTCDQSLLHAKH